MRVRGNGQIIKRTAIIMLGSLMLRGCDGGDVSTMVNPEPICIPNEELLDSECLAEDLFNVCEPYFCEELASEGVDAIPPDDPLCRAIDCQNIACTFINFVELEVVEIDAFPALFGVFLDDLIGNPDIPFGPCGF